MLQEHISVELLDVLLYKEKSKRPYTAGRPFSALSFRLDGRSDFDTEQGTLSAETGSVVYVPQGKAYTRVTEGETIAVFHFHLHDPVTDAIEVFLPENVERYRVLFSEALRIWEEKPRGYRHAATALFYRILAAMEEDGVLFTAHTAGLAERAAEYLQRHFREQRLTVSALAEHCHVSEAYLRRVFHARYGVAPKAYLDGVRIAHAESLLETGYYSQKEIAHRVGYGDVKYFRTAFKARTGKTPSEYLRFAAERRK